MTKQPLPFHNLEFFDEPTFWAEGDALARYAFLMPVSVSSEFVAFGVLRPSEEILFVARGKVQEHLGQFIFRMTQEQARVELYTEAPVPAWLRKKYASDEPPYEGHDYEGPPRGPVNGLTPVGTQPYPSQGSPLWPAGEELTRRALLIPVNEPSRFLVLGIQGQTPQVCFAFTGSVQEQLGNLIAQADKEQASVELHAKPPLPEQMLKTYLTESQER